MHEEKSTLFKDWQKLAAQVAELQKKHTPFSEHLFHDLEHMLHLISRGLQASDTALADESFRKSCLENVKIQILFLRENVKLYYKGKSADAFLDQLEHIQQALYNFLYRRKKILILSSSFGNGHKVAAQAIAEGMSYCFGRDYIIEEIDFLETANKFMNSTVRSIYDTSSKTMPELYGWFFKHTDKAWQVKLLNYLSYPLLISKIEEMLSDKKPDIIISTFPLWDYTIKKVWEKYSKENKYISVITDSIRVHQSWITADTDYFIVSNDDTAHILRQSGIAQDKIKVLGFPLRPAFYQAVDTKAVKKCLNLSPTKKVLFYSVGTGGNKEDLDALLYLDKKLDPRTIQVIVVFGKNKLLHKKFEKKKHKKLSYHAVGWTDKIHELIQIADLVVTKPGGAIVMECIEKGTPMVITKVLPGQEEGNLTLLERYHLGIAATNNLAMYQAIQKKIGFKHTAEAKKNFHKVKKPNATIAISHFLQELLNNGKKVA